MKKFLKYIFQTLYFSTVITMIAVCIALWVIEPSIAVVPVITGSLCTVIYNIK